MIPDFIPPELRQVCTSWVYYHTVIKKRSVTPEEFLSRRAYNLAGQGCNRSKKSKYGPQDRFNQIEMNRHRQYCIRNGWTPYPQYLESVKKWYEKQKLTRTPKETPREKAQRILREKGLAPRGMAA